MSRLCVLKRFGFSVLMAAGLLVASSSPALAQASVSAGVDFTQNYIFRGIPQIGGPMSTQPWIEVAADVSDMASIAIGSWNSLNEAGEGPGAFYESDFYASVSLAFENVGVDVGYTAYMSPSDWFSTTHEIGLGFSLDNPAAPYAAFAFEIDGGADFGDGKGTYLELGVEPSYDAGAASLSIPVAVGLSLSNYYETAPGEDNTYGFFSAGVTVAAPLSDSVEFWGGLSVVHMGELGGDEAQGVVIVGLSVSN